MRESLADRFLSLLTPPKRAASITGDLLEEGQSRGVSWFWLQVIRTMLSLFCQELLSMPIRMTALIIMGIALLMVGGFSIHFLGSLVDAPQIFYAIGWHPAFNYWWKKWFVSLVWARLLYPFLVGLIVAHFARAKEVVICIATATLTEALVLAFYAWYSDFHIPMSVVTYNSLPLLTFVLAGAIARRSTLRSLSID